MMVGYRCRWKNESIPIPNPIRSSRSGQRFLLAGHEVRSQSIGPGLVVHEVTQDEQHKQVQEQDVAVQQLNRRRAHRTTCNLPKEDEARLGIPSDHKPEPSACFVHVVKRLSHVLESRRTATIIRIRSILPMTSRSGTSKENPKP